MAIIQTRNTLESYRALVVKGSILELEHSTASEVQAGSSFQMTTKNDITLLEQEEYWKLLLHSNANNSLLYIVYCTLYKYRNVHNTTLDSFYGNAY
jgi:hypothetical protein